MVLRLLVVHVTGTAARDGSAPPADQCQCQSRHTSQHNAGRAADFDRAAHVHRPRAPAVFVRRILDVGSARRHAPARRIRMSGTVCRTRRRPDALSADPHSRSRSPVGCGIAMSFLLCLCMMSFVSAPHLLSEALRPDADPGWPIRRDRLARLDCRRIFLSGRERTLESSPITVAAFFDTGNLDMA